MEWSTNGTPYSHFVEILQKETNYIYCRKHIKIVYFIHSVHSKLLWYQDQDKPSVRTVILTHVLKVCLAFIRAWHEWSSTVRAACNFSWSISARLELCVSRGCPGVNGGVFTSHYIQHWVCCLRDSIAGITFPFSISLLFSTLCAPAPLCRS